MNSLNAIQGKKPSSQKRCCLVVQSWCLFILIILFSSIYHVREKLRQQPIGNGASVFFFHPQNVTIDVKLSKKPTSMNSAIEDSTKTHYQKRRRGNDPKDIAPTKNFSLQFRKDDLEKILSIVKRREKEKAEKEGRSPKQAQPEHTQSIVSTTTKEKLSSQPISNNSPKEKFIFHMSPNLLNLQQQIQRMQMMSSQGQLNFYDQNMLLQYIADFNKQIGIEQKVAYDKFISQQRSVSQNQSPWKQQTQLRTDQQTQLRTDQQTQLRTDQQTQLRTDQQTQLKTENQIQLRTDQQTQLQHQGQWAPKPQLQQQPQFKPTKAKPQYGTSGGVYKEAVYYYPFDTYTNFKKPYIFPLRQLSKQVAPIQPIDDHGIIYYMYANDAKGCPHDNQFVIQTQIYGQRAKRMTPTINIAIVTNCDLPREVFKLVDYIIPIHPKDLVLSTRQTQFTTRMIYNRFPPFSYNLVMDAHTCWCSDTDAEDVFSKFRESDVDLSFSTRVLNKWTTSGFAVLYKYNQATIDFWTKIIDDNFRTGFHADDQYPMRQFAEQMYREGKLKFRWLSNNWFYAPHGVTEKGEFLGDAACYRSSVLINGRVRFIHGGGTSECELANGIDNRDIAKLRTHFTPQKCTFDKENVQRLVFSQEQMVELVAPHQAPKFNWTLLEKEDPDGLFWYADKGFIY